MVKQINIRSKYKITSFARLHIHGSNYVILKKTDLCQCSLTAGSWYIEANIAYSTEESDTMLTLYIYCQHGNNSLPVCREDED